MPKEVIRPRGSDDPFVLVVKWGPGMLQIGLATAGTQHLVYQLFGDAREEIGTMMREIVHAQDEAECGSDGALGAEMLERIEKMSGAIESLWFDPDRRGCNDIIKAVRRARNAEFGVDE